MNKLYLFFFPIFISGCSTTVQYVGKSYKPGNDPEVFVDESAIKNSYSIIGRGYIKQGAPAFGVNWNKVQRQAIQKGSEHGADAVLIIQKSTISTLPVYQTYGRIDSVGRSLQTYSRNEGYFPAYSWSEIYFLKYD